MPPPSIGVAAALLAAAAFRKPCGVVQISITRSSTAAGCGCAAAGAPGAAPAGGAMFQAVMPLTYWSGRCSTGAGRARSGSIVCLRVIWTRALGAA